MSRFPIVSMKQSYSTLSDHLLLTVLSSCLPSSWVLDMKNISDLSIWSLLPLVHYSLHYNQLLFSVMVSFCCGEKPLDEGWQLYIYAAIRMRFRMQLRNCAGLVKWLSSKIHEFMTLLALGSWLKFKYKELLPSYWMGL